MPDYQKMYHLLFNEITDTIERLERIQQDVERDYFMSPEAAKEYGLIDEIIKPRA